MAFAQFSSRPFPFVWSSVIYVVLQLMFLFSCIGIFIIFFFLASVLGYDTSLYSIPTMVVLGISLLVFLYFTNGLNASLMKAYQAALEGNKTTVADFLRYAFSRSFTMFMIMLVRDIVFALVAAPAVALYYYYLSEYSYMNYLFGIYIAALLFLIHFLFNPVFISAGAHSTNLMQSFRNGYYFLKRNHVYALGLYFLFAIVWVLNFIPLIQIVMIFAVYPVVYSAFLLMFQMSHGR